MSPGTILFLQILLGVLVVFCIIGLAAVLSIKRDAYSVWWNGSIPMKKIPFKERK